MVPQRQDAPDVASLSDDDERWGELLVARTAGELFDAWLPVLKSLTGARAALLLLAQDDGRYAPIATFPPGRDVRYLADTAVDALRRRQGVVLHDQLGHARIAYPLQPRCASDQPPHGAAVLDLGPADAAALARAQRLTHWGAGWLFDAIERGEADELRRRRERGAWLIDTLLALLAAPAMREAGSILVHRIAREFDCTRVTLALTHDHSLRVAALSNAASFDERLESIRLATQAMHEAFDQRRRIDWPDGGGAAQVNPAHRRYAETERAGALASVPLVTAGQVVGVVLVERDTPLRADELDCLDAAALALAPVIELKQRDEDSVIAIAARRAKLWLGAATGRRFAAARLACCLGALVLAALALVPLTYRVAARASVEGAVQRAIVAPFDGFLAAAPVRAGDVVKAGQVMARLDDRDLQLERVRWEAELEVAQRKQLEAMAKDNRVGQRLAAAQADQAQAQLDLVRSKLARADVTAPFDAVVVRGDQSQAAGAPVELGKVLFELAPLDSWRVALKVDERDVGDVVVGATGELVLTGMPDTRWRFTVGKVMPVAVAEEGRNVFRVEAALDQRAATLRPNLEGVAKIEAGSRSLLWIWTHGLFDWVRLAWWRWTP